MEAHIRFHHGKVVVRENDDLAELTFFDSIGSLTQITIPKFSI